MSTSSASDLETFRSTLDAFARAGDDPIDALSLDKFAQYFALLVRWGSVQNLTRHLDPETAARESFGDSWLGLGAIERVGAFTSAAVRTVLDVGTGAGFPGMVAAIRWPQVNVVLVEPLKKRCSFLEEVAVQGRLQNVSVRSCRIEDVSELGDLVLSRATVGVGRGYGALASRVAPGGALALFVGPSMDLPTWEEECTRLALLGPARVAYRGLSDGRGVVYARSR